MDDDFVEELERVRREWARLHGGAEIRWNAIWRGRIVEWVRKQQALGKVVPELAERLGIRVTQLRGWLYAPAPWQASDAEADRPPLRPVQILMIHKRQKYRCRCNASVQTAPAPLKLIPGGRYSLAFAVEVAIQKYAYHLPLERQVRMMRHEGLLVDSQTLWDQIEALARVLRPMYDAIRAHILLADVLHADETHWLLMQKGGSKKWYVWALSTEDAVYYHLNASRSKDVARRLLDGYRGVALTDGYAAYQSLQGPGSTLRLAHCMAHVRRKFIEALPAYPQSQQAIDLIGQLYAVERTLPQLSGRQGEEREQAMKLRLDMRKKESAPVMKEFHTWLTSQDALPKSLLHEALTYTLALWPGLSLFLDDPDPRRSNTFAVAFSMAMSWFEGCWECEHAQAAFRVADSLMESFRGMGVVLAFVPTTFLGGARCLARTVHNHSGVRRRHRLPIDRHRLERLS